MSNPFEFYLVETEPQYILASRKKDTRNSPVWKSKPKYLGELDIADGDVLGVCSELYDKHVCMQK
jgi:hypothetical protein